MNWYLFELRCEFMGRMCWVAFTRRPGWKPWGARGFGILRLGLGPLDFGYLHRKRLTEGLENEMA